MTDQTLDLGLSVAGPIGQDPQALVEQADQYAREQAAELLLDMVPAEQYDVLYAALSARVTHERNGGRQLRMFVPGKPAPQGSKDFKGFAKAAPGQSRGKAILVESSAEVGPWRARIALAAADAMMAAGLPVLDRKYPVVTSLTFVMPRPSGTPKSYTPPAVKRPDADKLERAVNDGLTDVCWLDDSQVVETHRRKVLAEISQQPGVHIRVSSPGWGDAAIEAWRAENA
ncbi:RusA-like resolvase [Mycobacterium phage ShedlockHolmes]|uniref:RusA-like resolvase n=3 Tax=Keshuvirus TaxID=2948781 RepID=G1D4X9_9CAUD|nr:RusA-like Holliday junction resolvase [Mycobacterium phage ShedlockHolmes]YP_009637408.1 RusA-like Holliday junction resolvase [Mycobacterium phage Pixie]AEK09880.1 RusA-like resolvase [Mycobacterium phage Pixie]AKF15250.1 RusA-like resolvase [Mycobacterium phage ShedlockHolmes]AOT23806.1 RusA-like resolvase [Mycobacterium phage TBond007]